MKDQEIDFWTKERDHCIKFMRPKHEMWRRLLNAYRLEFEGIKKKNLKKISRFYPLTRQILASITYNYPKVFFRVEDQNYEFASDILQRTANSALEVMNVMPEVRQASFDALYCYFGWLKVGFNPRGDDMVAPISPTPQWRTTCPTFTVVRPLMCSWTRKHRPNPSPTPAISWSVSWCRWSSSKTTVDTPIAVK